MDNLQALIDQQRELQRQPCAACNRLAPTENQVPAAVFRAGRQNATIASILACWESGQIPTWEATLTEMVVVLAQQVQQSKEQSTTPQFQPSQPQFQAAARNPLLDKIRATKAALASRLPTNRMEDEL
jgi:hypothetical protein